jgi:flagellar basal body rod protein FlgC
MFEEISRDRMVVHFSGAQAGIEPLTWGQKAIWQDMQESGGQFNMPGRLALPAGSTVTDVAARVRGLLGRHAALRMRLATDETGQMCLEVAGSGQIGLDILSIPDDADQDFVKRYQEHLYDTWQLERFDFYRDWPLRLAVVRHRDACLSLCWVLSHLAADGGAHLLMLRDLQLDDETGQVAREPRHPDLLDIARSEQTPQLRQLSRRTMRQWESQLRDIPPLTFAQASSAAPLSAERRYWQVRFSSPAAHLAMLAIARRTRTDLSRVTLAMIATAISRATGVHRPTLKVMVSNRFRPGFAEAIATISQTAVVTIDTADGSIDDVVARTRGASLTAGMRAYYDPDDLAEVISRLDAERGYQARVTCRVNDQRAMIMRAQEEDLPDVTPEQVSERLGETSLTWLGPREHSYEQANILVENRRDVLSLHMMWDLGSLTKDQVEALLRAVEEIAVQAAFDPSYSPPTGGWPLPSPLSDH